MTYTTIKYTFNQFCKKNDFLKSKINDIVFNYNKVAKEASMFANFHILRLISQNKIIPKLDQSFFQLCCIYVSEIYGRKEQIKKNEDFNISFDLYVKLRTKGYEAGYRDNITYLFNYLAAEMEISANNHLELNFYKRFKFYLKNKYPNTTSSYRDKVCNDIYEDKYIGNDPIVLEYRRKLNNPPYKKYFEKDPTAILIVYNEILSFNIEKNIKTFSLLPHKNGFQMSYITIDKSVLRDLIVSERLVPIKDGRKKTERDFDLPTIAEIKKDIKDNPQKYWDAFFNIKKKKGHKFVYFKTDGKTVGAVFEVLGKELKKKEKKSKKKEYVCPYKIEDYENVIGIDPGLRNTFVGFNSKNEIIKCSGKQYYHDSGVNLKNKRQQKCYEKNPVWQAYSANMPSPKTNNLEVLENYIKYVLEGLDNALGFHFNNPFRKWKFATFIKKQKVFHELCKKITKKAHRHDQTTTCLIGFGDWSNPRDSIIRGHKRGPVLELKNELKKWCPVVDVDEFRTSKLCNKCHHDTSKVKFNGEKINSVLRCNNNECGIIIDREINGAKNIFMVFEKILRGEERPKEFCR